MNTLKFRSKGQEVHLLQQILGKKRYDLKDSKYFGKDTDASIKDFQRKNNLAVEGIAGAKTLARLNEKENYWGAFNDKLLLEKNLIDFAQKLELAAVKAINEVECKGRGFLLDGRPKILFEGHVFWRQLEKRNIIPSGYVSEETKNVMYKKWTRSYSGGAGEYDRMEKAVTISSDPQFKGAAYYSASWGAFQIMRYHFKSFGYSTIDEFISKMNEHEREHSGDFGRFLDVNHMIRQLQSKNLTSYARSNNGTAYATNKYDIKLKNAYERFLNI